MMSVRLSMKMLTEMNLLSQEIPLYTIIEIAFLHQSSKDPINPRFTFHHSTVLHEIALNEDILTFK